MSDKRVRIFFGGQEVGPDQAITISPLCNLCDRKMLLWASDAGTTWWRCPVHTTGAR